MSSLRAAASDQLRHAKQGFHPDEGRPSVRADNDTADSWAWCNAVAMVGLRELRRQRALAGAARAGRYSRELAWDRQLTFLRRAWWPVLSLMVLCPVLSVPFVLWQGGASGWIFLGAMSASGFWLAVLFTVLVSGTAAQLMGVTAEEWTVEELRPSLRRGWRLVNGLKLRGDADIDHIAVGPAGVVVLETKWSAEGWPLGDPSDSFMKDRLARASEQARQSRRAVAAHFSRELGGAPVRAAVVLWSGTSTDATSAELTNGSDVTVVRGSALKRWIGSPRARGHRL